IGSDGYFFEPLWTNFKLSANPGILDWYTVLAGVVALVTLTTHGALYIALKTAGDLSRRARGIAVLLWPVQFFLTSCSLVATYFIKRRVMQNFREHPIGIVIPIVVFGSLGVIIWAAPKQKEKIAFLASCAYIVGMLVGAAFALYPVV